MKRVITALLILFGATNLIAQHHTDSLHTSRQSDTTIRRTLGKDLRFGHFEFHTRSFLMGTVNRGVLSDYSTMAVGAGLGYYSPSWKGFHVGLSGFFVFQVFQDNIYEKDPVTGKSNRYEILMFDINDYHNTHDLDRLEELFISYENKGFTAILGRQKFESPLLNGQDNRMRPNVFSGISLNYKVKNWEFLANWFNQVTIRGTVDWYSIQSSLGVYSTGRNPLESTESYKGNIHSYGIGVTGVKHQTKNWKNQIWNYNADNIFNTTFARSEYAFTKKNWRFLTGIEGFYEAPLNNGGNADQTKTYLLKNERAFGVGARLGFKVKGHQLTFNYLGISNIGRFLFPREWGREQFFASLPRERFEGAGDVNALTVKYRYTIPKKNFYVELGANYTDNIQYTDIDLNKYGLTSYYHFTGTLDYKFKGYLDGLELKFLAVHKRATDPANLPDKYRINKVEMWNLNFVIDYWF